MKRAIYHKPMIQVFRLHTENLLTIASVQTLDNSEGFTLDKEGFEETDDLR